MWIGDCDIFDPTSCGAQVCVVAITGMTVYMPASATPKAEGASCTHKNDCAPGFGCVAWGFDTTPTCHGACPKGSKGACDTHYECTYNFDLSCVHYRERVDPP